MPMRYVPISSVELDHFRDAREDPHPPNPRERMWVTLLVRTRCPEWKRERDVWRVGLELPSKRRRYSAQEYARRYGSSPRDMAKVAEFARKNGIRVLEANAEGGFLRFTGPVKAFASAFQVKIVNYICPKHGPYRSHDGPIRVPANLAPLIVGVFGFDTRPLDATPFLQPRHVKTPVDFVRPASVAAQYRFPIDATGKGQCVGIVELGGGFHRSDLKHFFRRLRLKIPKITVVELDGQKNRPASKAAIRRAWKKSHMVRMRKQVQGAVLHDQADSMTNMLWTVESTTDVELVGALANAAHIAVYFAPNTAHGKFDAYSTAIFDSKNRPGVISCSWGTLEDSVPPEYIRQVDYLLQCAALRGVTVCHSSGDEGADKDGGHGQVHFPASSPHALSVGGTQFAMRGGNLEESYWNEVEGSHHFLGGHGVSKSFKSPPWQAPHLGAKGKKHKGRAVPDVSGKADLQRAYWCSSAGISFPGFGTSAAAPMWSALIARLNEKLGCPVGFVTPWLYSKRFLKAMTPVGTKAGKKNAGARWNKRTGLGSPNGEELLKALQGVRG